MKSIIKFVTNFWRDETGATAIEYALMVGLIAAVIVAVVAALGTTIRAKFCNMLTLLGGSADSCTVTP